MMSSIDVPESLKEKLIQAATRRGYVGLRGQNSQIADFLIYLLRLDEAIGQEAESGGNVKLRSTLPIALGLLVKEGQPAPSDEAIGRILEERRIRH